MFILTVQDVSVEEWCYKCHLSSDFGKLDICNGLATVGIRCHFLVILDLVNGVKGVIVSVPKLGQAPSAAQQRFNSGIEGFNTVTNIQEQF